MKRWCMHDGPWTTMCTVVGIDGCVVDVASRALLWSNKVTCIHDSLFS